MIELTNAVIGGGIIALNLIPVFTDRKNYMITLPISVLIVVIKVLFFH